MITLNQLRAFAAVARHRHYTRAAKDLMVAQPSVSYQVHELERALDIQLIEIVGRRVHLTEIGERLAERVAGLLNELTSIEQEARDYRAGAAGRLRIGATRTVGGYALPPTLVHFNAANPGIVLKVTIANSSEVERLLLDRTVDLAVVEWSLASSKLVSRPLRRDALVLVAPPGHPLLDQTSVRLEDLRGQAFVMREPGSGTRALAEQALGSIASDILVALELDQPEAIVRAVEAGMGLAFISEVIVTRQLAGGSLRTVNVEGMSLGRDFSLVVLRDRKPSPSMRAFAAFIAEAWGAR